MVKIKETEMRKLVIHIGHLPFAELSPNSRVHWAVKARAVKASREEIGWLAKTDWRYKYGDAKPMMRAKISYEFCVKDKRRRDANNFLASAKSWNDGLIDAGVLWDDDTKHLVLGGVEVIPSDTEQSIITLEELD